MFTLLLSVASLFAQKEETPDDNYALGAKINDMTITEGGTVVVATNYINNSAGLVKLNKDTGALEKEILLKDKKPTYNVDEFSGYLYYQANDKTIYVYNLNN